MSDTSLLCKTVILEELREREPLFGQWRIAEFIGAGANGCVFRMEYTELGQTFVSALKVIPLTKEIDRRLKRPEDIQMTLGRESREILHLYRLSGHSNVVSWHNHQILYKEEEEIHTAYVLVMMDYLPNSLARELKRGPIPLDQSLEILVACLSGLAHIHSFNIIHRDIKPENIFITDEGTAKIGDFGIARQVSESMQARTVAGTPLYMAPEVYKDPVGKGYGYKADIYSIGLVTYEMIEGRLPFEDATTSMKDTVKRRFRGERVTFRTPIPEEFEKMILKALSFKPEDRWDTAREFLHAMEHQLRMMPARKKSLSSLLLKNAKPFLGNRNPGAGQQGDTPLKGSPDKSTIMLKDIGPATANFSDSSETIAGAPVFDEEAMARAGDNRRSTPPLPENAPAQADAPPAKTVNVAAQDSTDPWADIDAPSPEDRAAFRTGRESTSHLARSNRRMVRILAFDSVVEHVYFSQEVCERIIYLAREIIAAKQGVPLELDNRHSLYVENDKICGRVVAVGLIEDIIMAEVEIDDAHSYDANYLLDTERYQIIPKYLGFYLNRGENKYLRSLNLQLISFCLYDPHAEDERN